MIWNSIPLMTVIDLAMIFLTLIALRSFYRTRHLLKQLDLLHGSLLMMCGLIIIVMFYVADISVMHILPMFVPLASALSTMTKLHLSYNWVASAVGVSCIILSVLYFNRTLYPQIRALEKKLVDRASTDSLTKTHNRSKFDEILTGELQRSKRYNQSLSLIEFDIDRFKAINDNYGHLQGDYVLKTVVELAKRNVRNVDHLARWGGEEFMIILPQTGLERAEAIAERIKEEVETHDFDKVAQVTMSFGVAEFRMTDSEETLIKRADDALYAAKRNGRNRVEVGV